MTSALASTIRRRPAEPVVVRMRAAATVSTYYYLYIHARAGPA
jgi:hypothetical protein